MRDEDFDIFEDKENFIIYKITNKEQRNPDISNLQTKKEILQLVNQKNKFDYNKKLLDEIRDKKFTETNFEQLGKDKIQSITINSINDNKKFEINSIKMLYSLPINTITLINDDDDKIYLAKIKNFVDLKLDANSKDYDLSINKENTRMRTSILQSYDLFLNDKYNVNINQIAINNVKNLFQ